MTNWLAIVNRHSGGIRSLRRLQPILDRVRQLASYTVFTEYKGHARALATQAGAFEGLLVVGGDGTLLEVLNGLDPLKQRLAIIPIGRGNSLARDLGLYPLASCFNAIECGYSSCIDLMEASFEDSGGGQVRSLSASTIAVGYPAAVVRTAGARFGRFGVHCYAMAAACVRPETVEMRISGGEGGSVEKCLTGFVANNTRYLGNFLALPGARCHDGHFDVMEMRAGFIRQSVHNLSALSRLQFYNPVRLTAMTRVALTLKRPQELMVDGELFEDVISLQIGLRESAVDFVRGKQTL
jgi:diacylglycerol kinase family enzyme